ncbi:cytochrome C biogenesis protein CcmA [Aeromonas veronii]|uniref:cytochrome c biogenesis heme-transporting ATPase CcmA n=1 Tax=Aeromonas veronii TaxID=654 RepID=UPI00071862A5|nr:cytochrome c biogenesis heme-transporting ATPase CcmA [Aeromonas veronii]KRV70129.1 cytochrome C biogenesis protein CcmA [Aeromonas veronii]KRV79003.1 cytochrome C biogenesis protein CcmA [Aeromonas veronii]KRV90607.1 cytochrome C biogenesis protein CcmA [Aeromonas veronii]KRV91885.1 cytochrome C biogenesis protein CcmA [Aeromonas veronii]
MLLQVNNLSCVREDRTLFEHLSFSVALGDLVQIEGPNGVGKTSLLRLLTGLSQPFAGEVCWNGENIRHCRDEYHANLLYLGHQPGVKAALTPFENLKFYQQLHHPQQTETDLWQILARVGLAGFEENPTGQLSAGQQRRVALARLWLSQKAALWILDEPFTAIDKQGVKVLEQLFLEHAERGGMVILTTHQDLTLMQGRLKTISLTPFASTLQE